MAPDAPKGLDELVAQTDMAFVVDTTGSMQPFINAARKHIGRIARDAVRDGLALRLGLVEYRDHPPEDSSFATAENPIRAAKVWQFTESIETFEQWLESLKAEGGGDEAEAVWDGLIACANMHWREHANRIVWLVGDSPPHGGPYLRHGASRSDWHNECPCRATLSGVVETLAGQRVTLNAITLEAKSDLEEAFGILTKELDGVLEKHPGEADIAILRTIAPSTSALVHDTHMDSAYYCASTSLSLSSGSAPTPTMVAESLGVSVESASASYQRLRKRKLVE